MEECSVLVSDKKWYFSKEELDNTPSRRCGIDADKEMNYRQQASNFIRDMGRKLSITKLGVNTAIVYMHRFYMFHSLSHFHRNAIAPAALFLAAKVEEQPRKLEYIINVAYMCLNRGQTKLDPNSGQYHEMAKELVFHENVLLQTLGFDVAIYHPHAYVIKCCNLVNASQELIQTSLLIASNSVHLTTMCLQYRPTIVACLCIYIACKWSSWEIPQSEEGKHWFWYVDPSVTIELLQQLTDEFLHVFDKCPSRLKNITPNEVHSPTPDTRPKIIAPDNKNEEKVPFSGASTSGHPRDVQKHYSHHKQDSVSSMNPVPIPTSGKHQIPTQKTSQHYSHHHRPDPKLHQSSQRHTSSSQSHNQQSKDHQRSSTATYHHRPSGASTKDPSLMTRETSGVSEMSHNLQEVCQINQTPTDRLSNNNQNSQRVPQLNKHGYDPRQKTVDHKKEDPKNFAKSNGQNKEVRQDPKLGKSHVPEPRNGEIRKPIDKSIPLPKPQAEIQKEKYISLMLKKSHNPTKYPEKVSLPHNAGRNNAPPGSSKVHAPVKPPQQAVPRVPPPTTTPTVKDTKNGNSNILPVIGDVVNDTKVEKRPRRSLFSPETPEKTPPSRKTNLKASKLFGPKVPTVPATVKEINQERISDSKVPEYSLNQQRSQYPSKTLKTEEPCAYESMKMLGHTPDPIQRIANYSTSMNNWPNPVINDPKLPERPKVNPKPENVDSRHSMTNGLDSSKHHQEMEFDHAVLDRLNDFPVTKTEYLSPMKSAESINALLQEPLAPMPSLLAPSMNNSEILSQHLSQQSTSNISTDFKKGLNESREPEIPETLPITTEQQIDVETISPIKVKSEHHKSEKKKKKDKKHKHKHKDSSKEKHKHRHKEKHREKSPAPIRITISKDKLNLSPDTLSGSLDKKSTHGPGLKIKIPKEKLIRSEPVQTSLKITISTSGAVGEILESRKRDRERDSVEGAPMKKKTTAPGVYPTFEEQQRPSELQNGLHYPATNNEDKHSCRGSTRAGISCDSPSNHTQRSIKT